jgi:hypothetical protein
LLIGCGAGCQCLDPDPYGFTNLYWIYKQIKICEIYIISFWRGIGVFLVIFIEMMDYEYQEYQATR